MKLVSKYFIADSCNKANTSSTSSMLCGTARPPVWFWTVSRQLIRKLAGRCEYLVSYQREVDKGKLTPVASFEKLTFRA